MIAVSVLILALFAQAEPPKLAEAPEPVRRYLAAAQADWHAEIASLAGRIEQAQNSLKLNGRRTDIDRREKSRMRIQLQKEIKDLRVRLTETDWLAWWPEPEAALRLDGNPGTISGTHFEVLQVVKPGELLARGQGTQVNIRSIDGSFRAGTVVARDAPAETTQLVLLRGIDPKKFTNPERYPIEGVWHATGMYTYVNALGTTNTVLIIEPFDVSQVEPYRAAYDDERQSALESLGAKPKAQPPKKKRG